MYIADMTPLESASYLQFLKTQSYVSPRPIGDGRWAALFQFMFTWAIIVGEFGEMNEYANRWCYETLEKAEEAFAAWDGQGEPEGWHRHPATGRRRYPGQAEVIRM